METKKILGLDIGTNSIGAAIVNIPKTIDDFGKGGNIEWLGSRIIPVDGEYLQKFESGSQPETKAAARRKKRGSRRLKHRYKLRRSRLTRIFKILGWVKEDFPLDNPKQIKNILRENDGRFEFRMNDYLPISDNSYKDFYGAFGVPEKDIVRILEEIKYRKNSTGKHKYDDLDLLPEDWVVYYLRKKALTEKISTQELARILYMMNQRRGFKSSRKDLQQNSLLNYEEFKDLRKKIEKKEIPEYLQGNGKEEKTQFVSTTVVESIQQISQEADKNGKYQFRVKVSDGRIFPWIIKRKEKPEWEGKEYKFLVEQKINRKGEIKQDSDPKTPKPDDWTLTMVSLDEEINNSGKQVGEFFWDKLVEFAHNKEMYKIRQNVIRREKYQKEFKAIWNKQAELRKADGTLEELINTDRILEIANSLYKNNAAKQKELIDKGLYHILANDIIYYQRDLKSQKHTISECRYEKRIGREKTEDGEYTTTGIYGLRCAPISSPLFQEFRIWQDIHNIRILQKEKREKGILRIDVDVTRDYLTESNKNMIFDLFDSTAEITETKIFEKLNELNAGATLSEEQFRVNLFVNREKLKGNETKEYFRKIFRKHDWEIEGEKLLSNFDQLFRLWHIMYSISSSDLEKSQKGIRNALKKSFPQIPEEITAELCKQEEFKKDYAAYSAKAIKFLLAVMRCGNYWSWENILNTKIKAPESSIEKPQYLKLSERIDGIINNGWEKEFKVDKRTGEIIKQRKFESREQFQGLPGWLACYIVYGRHSEHDNTQKFTSKEEISRLNVSAIPGLIKLKGNPLVKQVVQETIQVVKDICLEYGQPDEIHIELGRELKKNTEQRAAVSEKNKKNLEEKLRAKKLLKELLNDSFEHHDEQGNKVKQPFSIIPNPNSPADIEKFRLYKSCAAFEWNDKEKKNEDQVRMDALFSDGKKERIPSNAEVKKYILWLSQQCRSPYTGKIIPLSKLFDETQYEVEHIIPRKKMKYDANENLVICEYGVNKAKGDKLAANFILQANGICSYGNTTYILLKFDEYEKHCKKTFHGKKYKNLMATEVPEDFIERQINDTRYIGRKLGELLYPFAKDNEGLIFSIGSITSELKNKWGLNKIWKRLLEPRFRRLEKLNGKTYIHQNEHDANDIDFDIPEISDFDSKRIDHRHHALDALIVAATTREHIRYFNTLSAADTNEEKRKLNYTLCKGKIRDFKLPWETFTKEAKKQLCETIVTFKTNNKVISKPFNRYVRWLKKQDGSIEKQRDLQKQNPSKPWLAVRKSLFNENPLGIIYVKKTKEVDVKKAFRIQIERMLVENDKNKRKTSTYVYDQIARPILKDIINKTIEATGINLTNADELYQAIEQHYLKKNKKGKTYLLNDMYYEKIVIAEFLQYKAKRVSVDKSFTEDKISKIPYSEKSPIALKLREHLNEYGKPNEAFEGEGLEKLRKKNNNKPIRTITVTDGEIKDKHRDNLFGNKYFEPAAGSIAFYVIYESEKNKEREEYFSVAAHKAIEKLKWGKPVADKKEGYKTIILQPGDLVYVPTDEEWGKLKNGEQNVIDWNNKKTIVERIYKMVSADDAFFIQHHISKAIIPYKRAKDGEKSTVGEIGYDNKSTKMLDGKTNIIERFIKLKIDRLGNVRPVL